MIVFRYMSKKEFNRYLTGENLKNNTRHQGFTSSVGFCFFDVNEFSPEYSYLFLSGIVSKEVCAVFETESKLTESCGRYADPYGSWFSSIQVDELCIKKYSDKDFKLVKFALNIEIDYDEDDETKSYNWIVPKKKLNYHPMKEINHDLQKLRNKGTFSLKELMDIKF